MTGLVPPVAAPFAALDRILDAGRPDGRVVLEDETQALDRTALAGRVTDLAGLLVAAGLRPGDRALLHAAPSAAAVCALLAVARAGATAVPLAADAIARHAVERLDAARPAVVVVDTGTGGYDETARVRVRDRAAALRCPIVDLAGDDGPVAGGPGGGGAVAPAGPPLGLFTSGSTGAPKGIPIGAAAIDHFVGWLTAAIALGEDDTVVGVAPLTFDLSLFDVFGTLSVGGRLVVADRADVVFPRRLLRRLATAQATVLYTVPTQLVGLLAQPGFAADQLPLRAILFAGEELPVEQARSLRSRFPHARLLNLFGPTETNVCLVHEVGDATALARLAALPIGRPVPGTECRIRPVGLTGQPAGIGELEVRGPSVMPGYWGSGTGPGTAVVDGWYATGDLVSLGPDGEHRFHGRRDRQLKIDGLRIEPAEVEGRINALSGVRRSAVVAGPGPTGRPALVCFVEPVDGAEPVVTDMVRALRDDLPAHLVPRRIEVLPVLPTTASGKIDRAALAARLVLDGGSDR